MISRQLSWALLGAGVLMVASCDGQGMGDRASPEPKSVETMDLVTSAGTLASKFSFVLNGSVTDKSTDVSTIHQAATESLVEFSGTGSVMGWSLPSAPQMQVGWAASIDQHDALARAYFLQLGVNEGELGPLTHFSGHSKGAPTSNPEAEQVTDLGYSSSFQRTVSGFDVVDSRASVQLNAKGQSVAFHFFWPSVPSSIIALAQRLQAALSQGWTPATGIVDAGWTVVRTHVTIHHGLAGDASLNWLATIRLELLSGTKASYVDCDINGKRVYPSGGTVSSPQNRP